jgi:hypothetical protein
MVRVGFPLNPFRSVGWTMLDHDVMALFAARHGMALASALSAAGLSRRSRQRLVEEGVLEVLYERVFHITSTPVTLEARCAALCLAYQRGFVTGPTAGRLLGLRRMPNGPLHFAVPHGAHIGPHPGVLLRQTTSIPPGHVTTRKGGIRVASPARLAFDLGHDLSIIDHRSVVEQMIQEGFTSWPKLAQVGKQLCHPARPGSLRFSEILHSQLPGGAAESHPEVVVAEGLRRRGVPIELQVGQLSLPNGRSIRFDMAVPDRRWAVEIDVHPSHVRPVGISNDKRRDRWCHRIDWQVERVTEIDLLDVEGLCDELTDLFHLRCQALEARG